MNRILFLSRSVWRFFWAGLWQKLVVIAALVAVIALISAVRPDSSPNGYLTVERGSILQTVSVTGQITAATSVNLSFGASGRVASVPVSVGERVVVGTLLASLDNAELGAQYRDAQANVQTQQARLDEVRRGTRSDEIAITEAEFNRAVQDLDDEYDTVRDSLITAYAYVNDAIRVELDDHFEGIGTHYDPSFDLTYSCASVCTNTVYEAERLRKEAETQLTVWSERIQGINLMPNEQKYDVLLEARDAGQTARQLLDAVDSIVNHLTVSLPEADLNTYRADVSAARTSVATALSTISSKIQAINSARLTADRSASELALKRAGSTPEQIAAQEAVLLSAQANVDRIGALIAKNLIRSPIAGIVTVQDAKPGETVSAGTPLVSVITDDQLQIEANIPEIDAGSVVVGDAVRIEIDALQGLILNGHVGALDPAETVIDGVVSYKVTVFFDETDERLRSGLTTELDIETDRRDDVLIIPQYAVIERDEGSFVVRPDGEEVRITLGIWSQDGDVEVTSGLAEGDRVKNIGLKQNP